MLFWTALTSIIIMLVSLSGVVVVYTGAGNWLEKNLAFITSFAAGVFLVVSAQLIRHTLKDTATLWWPALWILVGIAIVYGLFRLLPGFHHHDHCDDCKTNLSPSGILFGDGLHNIGDGLLLAASFQVSIAAGIAAGVAVLIHEIVQEVSEFFVLKASGFTTIKALTYNFAVSSTILIGAAGGYFATTQAEVLRTPLLAVAAGSFLVVVTHDFIPHSFQHTHNWRDAGNHILWFGGGLVAMVAALLVVGH
jgi:zinc and cadmium transporter